MQCPDNPKLAKVASYFESLTSKEIFLAIRLIFLLFIKNLRPPWSLIMRENMQYIKKIAKGITNIKIAWMILSIKYEIENMRIHNNPRPANIRVVRIGDPVS